MSPRLRGGVLQPHRCRDCVRNSHSSSCREVGPQPRQDYYGRPFFPEMSLETPRLITPPEPMQTALLVPRLEQEEEVGEKFFADQAAVRESSRGDDSFDVFVDDGDDDESVTEPGRPEQREDTTASAMGWCNGGAVRLEGSMATVAAGTLGQMTHGRWRSCIEKGMPSGIVHTGEWPWTAQISVSDSGLHLGMTKFRLKASVYDGTGEELVQSLIAMLE